MCRNTEEHDYVSFKHSEAFHLETVFKLGFDKMVGFHQAKETASTETRERAHCGELRGKVQCGWNMRGNHGR